MKFPDLKAKETPPNHTWTRKQAKEMHTCSNSALLPAGSVLRSGATGLDQSPVAPTKRAGKFSSSKGGSHRSWDVRLSLGPLRTALCLLIAIGKASALGIPADECDDL